MRASRILICSTAHQPPLRLSPNLVRSRTSSPKPVNRSAHLRTTPAGNWQTAVPVRLPLPLPRSSFHDSRERASIIVDERERARERESSPWLISPPLNRARVKFLITSSAERPIRRNYWFFVLRNSPTILKDLCLPIDCQYCQSC